MQVVLVHLQPFRCKSLLECALQAEIAKKINQKPSFGGLRSSKVIDVNKSKTRH